MHKPKIKYTCNSSQSNNSSLTSPKFK
uniref:Uncharacterized protein n=1 Tax=Arundo donax TaxID=35708 RepID=A0A0A9AKE5_ARUDO